MGASQQTVVAEVSHLSHEALARLRSLLLDESRAHALQSVEHEAVVSQLRDHTDVDSMLERELAEAGAARARAAMADIEHALACLDTGTYGWCEECGAAIPFERLEVVPSARLCVACPDRRSRRGP